MKQEPPFFGRGLSAGRAFKGPLVETSWGDFLPRARHLLAARIMVPKRDRRKGHRDCIGKACCPTFTPAENCFRFSNGHRR
jgi:hypothetical protein